MVHHGVHHGGDHTDAGHLRAVGVWILISYLVFYSVLVMHSVATVLIPDYQTGAGRRRRGLESLYRLVLSHHVDSLLVNMKIST